MFTDDDIALAEEVIALAREKSVTLITAESCTGGLIAAVLTEIPGASDVFVGGQVSYANEAKQAWLGVEPTLLSTHGAVSEPVAMAMAKGAVVQACAALGYNAQVLSVAVTGIAGPGGGSEEKPVGTVHIAALHYPIGSVMHEKCAFSGDRRQIRLDTTRAALGMLRQRLSAVS